MAPTLFTLSVLAASLAGVLAEPNGGSYIGDNDEWTPKFAATAWAPSRRGNNGGVHLFFTGSDDCNGIQQVTLQSGYHGHHRRADPSQSLHGGSSSLNGNSNSNNANSNSNSNNRGQSNSNSNSQSQSNSGNTQSQSSGSNTQSQNSGSNSQSSSNSNSGHGQSSSSNSNNVQSNSNSGQNNNNNNNNSGHQNSGQSQGQNTNSQSQSQGNNNQQNGNNQGGRNNQGSNVQSQGQNGNQNHNSQNGNQNFNNQNFNNQGSNNQNHGNNNNNNFNSQNFGIQNHGNRGRWTKGYCFNSDGGRNNWNINTDAAFAVTSVGSQNDLGDMRIFYWAKGHGNSAILRDAYWSARGGGHHKRGGNNYYDNYDNGRWKAGRLSKTVSRASLGSLAATSWVKDDKVGRTVFYIQGGFLRELTLDCEGEGWDDQDRDGIELHFNPGEMSAVSWVDDKGVLHKRVYVQNDDTQEVAEYTWSDATVYTEANNLYATKFVETGAAASAASLQVSRGKPNLFLWTVGSNGGNVMEDDDTHGTNAKAGTALAAASAQGWGGSSYVFFINTDGHLVQSNRDGDGDWHENVTVKFCDDD